jgi:hypothetical protein
MPEPTSSPSRDVGVTIPCPVCRRAFALVGRQRFCSAACRQTAYRRRQQDRSLALVLPPRRSRRAGTIYQCPACEARYLGTQRCPECGVFCSRVGPGGLCPHCDEPIALCDLVAGVEGAG